MSKLGKAFGGMLPFDMGGAVPLGEVEETGEEEEEEEETSKLVQAASDGDLDVISFSSFLLLQICKA